MTWPFKIILLSTIFISLNACQSLNSEQAEVSEAAQYFKSRAHQLFEKDHFQEAQIMTKAWIALAPVPEATMLLEKIDQRRQELFSSALQCTKQNSSVDQHRHCLKRLLRYQPDYQPAVEALRGDMAEQELASLIDSHEVNEAKWRKTANARKPKKTNLTPQIKPQLERQIELQKKEEKNSAVKAKVQEIHGFIAVDQWVPAGKLLLGIKDQWSKKQENMMPLRQSVAENLYLEGQRLFRGSVGQAIEMWELALAIDQTHSRAKIKLIRAYKIRDNLNKIN